MQIYLTGLLYVVIVVEQMNFDLSFYPTDHLVMGMD